MMNESAGGNLPREVIELRIPLKSEFLPILRATVGVIAAVMSFNYDEIMQFRVAVSEAFDLALKYDAQVDGVSEVTELAVRFLVETEKLEVLITNSTDYPRNLDSEEEQESKALLKSLMDEVEFGSEAAGKPLMRMVKFKSPQLI